MTVTTTFDDNPDAFTATGLPGCDSGLVYDGGAHVQFTPSQGIFAGYKVTRYSHDHPRNWFDRKLLKVSVGRSENGQLVVGVDPF